MWRAGGMVAATNAEPVMPGAPSLVAVSLAVVLASHPLAAQSAVATSGLNVRRGQTTAATIVGHIADGDTVALVSLVRRNDYLHVRLRNGVVGWAWAQRLTRIVEPPPAPEPDAAPAAFDTSWARSPSNAAAYRWPEGDSATCGASGSGGDRATNAWKNRTDSATTYHPVMWSALARLPFPRNGKSRRTGSNGWTAAELARIARYEGTPISVEGYLSGVREQIPPIDSITGKLERGETANCGGNTSPRVDWHVYLTAKPNDSHRQAIVVEATPRVRPAHPGWTLDALQQLSAAGTPVRVSGWLMFDPEHWDQMWKYLGASDTVGVKARITLWEIHPITRIEVKRDGAWHSLDAP